jgi:Ca-activated chloride channel family protein
MPFTGPEFVDRCRTRFRIISLASALLLVPVAFGQQPQPTPPEQDPSVPVRIKTDLVTLTLTVTDLYGRYVSGLSKNAFTVFDSNQEQEITFFSDSDAPVSVGVLFDVSGSMSGEKIQKACDQRGDSAHCSHSHDSSHPLGPATSCPLWGPPD